MKNLFIIDGAAGTGKSDLLKYLAKEKQGVGIMKKITTRDMRDEEKVSDYTLDLEFDKQKFYDSCNDSDFYHYVYGNVQYGFFKPDLEMALSSYNNVFIIIRNNNLVKKLKEDFPNIKIILVSVQSDTEEVEKRLKKLNYNEQKINFRLERNNIALNDYQKHSEDYDEILNNNYNITDYEKLIDQLIAKYNEQ